MKRLPTTHQIAVRVSTIPDGRARGEVVVFLRGGDEHVLASHDWPAGAPTPQQLELFQASINEAVLDLCLAFTGIQGAIDSLTYIPIVRD